VEHWAAENMEAVGTEETKAPKEQHAEPVATAAVVASVDPPIITVNEQV